MSRMFAIAWAVGALVIAADRTPAGANALPVPPPKSTRPLTPGERAVEAYNKGLEHRNRALQADARAAKAASAAGRAEHARRAREEYERALERFQAAADLDPALPQAWNAVGFAYRKLGDFERALASYERALTLAPDYPDAIEYRGEAYLALDRLEDAKGAYLALFAIDRPQADLLMQAMREWTARRKANPAGLDPAAVSAFESWVAERAAIARRTRLMDAGASRATW